MNKEILVDVPGRYPSYDGIDNYMLCQLRENQEAFIIDEPKFEACFKPRYSWILTKEKLNLYFSVFVVLEMFMQRVKELYR